MKPWARVVKAALGMLLAAAAMVNLAGCATQTVQAADLMGDIKPKTVAGQPANDRFIQSMADFSVELFKHSHAKGGNSLISPLSVVLALAMTANGADDTTLAQMEQVLGGEIPLEELNAYLRHYVSNLPSQEKAKLSIANSIWFREGLQVEPSFLQTNADYYGAAAYRSAFDDQTVKDINQWVKTNTNGMIDKMVEQIDHETVMYLVNALVFEAEWEKIYQKDEVRKGDFSNQDGSKQSVKFMFSDEQTYVSDSQCVGFVKPYANNTYSFAAILPSEDISVDQYLDAMTGESLMSLLRNAKQANVNAVIPKFQCEYVLSLDQTLKTMGMPQAFDPDGANFSRLCKAPQGNLYISQVLHKTYLALDERGTKAGAVTSVEIMPTAAQEVVTVRLDRPFIYCIIHNDTNLPVFMGVVNSLQG